MTLARSTHIKWKRILSPYAFYIDRFKVQQKLPTVLNSEFTLELDPTFILPSLHISLWWLAKITNETEHLINIKELNRSRFRICDRLSNRKVGLQSYLTLCQRVCWFKSQTFHMCALVLYWNTIPSTQFKHSYEVICLNELSNVNDIYSNVGADSFKLWQQI